MLLKDLPEDARPREKLLARGPGALSDAELLALLLRTGLPGKNALQMGQELLDNFGGVAGLLHTGPEALKSIKGLGPAKRAEIVAVLELARRALTEELKEKALFATPQAVRDYLQLMLGSRPYEIFAVLFLDSQHRLIALEELFRGTLTQTSVEHRRYCFWIVRNYQLICFRNRHSGKSRREGHRELPVSGDRNCKLTMNRCKKGPVHGESSKGKFAPPPAPPGLRTMMSER